MSKQSYRKSKLQLQELCSNFQMYTVANCETKLL